VSKRAREELECEKMTQGLVAKGKLRRLRKQFEACASAQADVLHGIPADMNIKNWTLEGSTPSKTEKETASRGGTGNVETPSSPE
jgi:hypothetical protein